MNRSILVLVAASGIAVCAPAWGQDSGATGNTTVAPTEAGTGTSTMTVPAIGTTGTGTSGAGTAGTGISGTSPSGSNSSRTNSPVSERFDTSSAEATPSSADRPQSGFGWIALVIVVAVLGVFSAKHYAASIAPPKT